MACVSPDKYGLNVTSLNIAQVKEKHGFEKRENYNKGKDGHRVLNCPPEKEKAIEDAFRYDKIVVAAATYNMGIFPWMEHFLMHLQGKNYQNRKVGIIENAIENNSMPRERMKIAQLAIENGRDILETSCVMQMNYL